MSTSGSQTLQLSQKSSSTPFTSLVTKTNSSLAASYQIVCLAVAKQKPKQFLHLNLHFQNLQQCFKIRFSRHFLGVVLLAPPSFQPPASAQCVSAPRPLPPRCDAASQTPRISGAFPALETIGSRVAPRKRTKCCDNSNSAGSSHHLGAGQRVFHISSLDLSLPKSHVYSHGGCLQMSMIFCDCCSHITSIQFSRTR